MIFNYFGLLYFPFRVSNFAADGSQVGGRIDSAGSLEARLHLERASTLEAGRHGDSARPKFIPEFDLN